MMMRTKIPGNRYGFNGNRGGLTPGETSLAKRNCGKQTIKAIGYGGSIWRNWKFSALRYRSVASVDFWFWKEIQDGAT